MSPFLTVCLLDMQIDFDAISALESLNDFSFFVYMKNFSFFIAATLNTRKWILIEFSCISYTKKAV